MHVTTNAKVLGMARAAVLVLLVVIAVSCGGHSPEHRDAAATGPAPAGAPSAPRFGGVMLDVWGGGSAAPGRSTTMFVHRGDRAVELYWTTDGWCLARVMRWTVENEHADHAFDVVYTVQQRFTGCMAGDEATQTFRVFDVQHRAGATTMVGADDGTWTVRTTCGSVWSTAGPCGFPGAAAVIPEF